MKPPLINEGDTITVRDKPDSPWRDALVTKIYVDYEMSRLVMEFILDPENKS